MPDRIYSGAHYVNNFWIKDPTNYSTHKLNYDNAELSMALSGLHNISFNSFATMPQMDIGTMLSAFWNNAFKAANAEFAQMMMFMPSFNAGGAFQMPGMAQGIGAMTGGTATGTGSSTSITGAKLKDDLTEEQVEEATELQTEIEEQISEYKALDENTRTTLGIDNALKNLEKDFKKADTPEKLKACQQSFNDAIDTLDDELLLSALEAKKFPVKDKTDAKAAGLYSKNSTRQNIKNLLIFSNYLIFFFKNQQNCILI